MYGSERCSKKLSSLSSKKPESARTRRIFWRCPHSARASWRKLHHPTRSSAVAAAEPAVEQEVSFGEHGQQRMMTGASVFAWIVPLQRALLLAIAFEDGGIQIQAVAIAAGGQPLHLPLGQRIEETMHVAHAKTPEEIADGVVNGKARQAQQGMQGAIIA